MSLNVPQYDTTAQSVRVGWLARQSLSRRIILATMTVTLLVMGAMIAVTAHQDSDNARDTVQREMAGALAAADESLQLIFKHASTRAGDLMPLLQRALGGLPAPDGTMVAMGDSASVPRLLAGGRQVNGDDASLERVRDATGAEPAVIARAGNRWIRIATLLTDAQGRRRNGSLVEPDDVLAKALDKGEAFSGMVQRNGRWYALSVLPLRDSTGQVYGGLTVRTDVNDSIVHVLDWVERTRIAGHGDLSLLQRATDGKTFARVTAAGHAPSQAANITATVASDSPLGRLLADSKGFAEVDLTQGGGADFVSWRAVPHWNWVMVADGKRADFMAEAHRALYIQSGLMILGAFLIAALAGVFSARALRPVREMLVGMQQLGQGDLTARIPDAPQASRNEVHALFGSLKQMQQNLRRTVAVVRRGVDEIYTGASEIAAGNTDLSSRTEEQAASLEQTAAAMEELSTTVKQNADTARQASTLSMSASDDARRGGAAVSTVAQTMEGISASSRKIAEIVALIDGIAFQTNILALNAAVEAARAGEQGRGFAVVAGEVRALAQRSAVAAKEIKALIDDSTTRVGVGAQQVEAARATMEQIVASVVQLTGLVNNISHASDEQSRGIEEVNRAVAQMDQVTQQNAALVEQAAAAAGSLEEQSRHLAQAVAVFKVDASPAGEASAPLVGAHTDMLAAA